MKRYVFFLYGVSCYLLFLGLYAYMAAFMGGFLVPKTIDSPAPQSWSAAIAVNLALVAIFAAQHSVMARPAFKRIWTRIVPQTIERSTYVLASCLATGLLMWQWRGIVGSPGTELEFAL